MNKIKQDIKNNEFAPVYLIYGNESFLVRTNKNNLIKALCNGKDDMNYTYFEGKGSSVAKIIEMAETMPFFADRRLIVVENSGFFKGANPELAQYIDEQCETSHIVFIETEIDKRGKLYKSVNKKGYVCECGTQTTPLLINWIGGVLKKDGIQIEASTASYLLEKVGTNMEKLRTELEKLICYVMGRDVLTIEDINEICVGQPVDKIFDIVDEMIKKDQKKALAYYYDLVALQVTPSAIMGTMSNHFKRLLYIKSMGQEGFPKGEIAKVSGVPPYYLDKYLGQSRHFTKEELKAALE